MDITLHFVYYGGYGGIIKKLSNTMAFKTNQTIGEIKSILRDYVSFNELRFICRSNLIDDHTIERSQLKDQDTIFVILRHNDPYSKYGWKQNFYGESEETICCICLENDSDTFLIPCVHDVYCQSCSEKINKCSICMQDIDSRWKKPIKKK